MNNIIASHIIGGLGNQLFQIFTTMAYAYDNEMKCCFTNFKGMKGADGTSPRPPYWNTFFKNLKEDIIDFKDLQNSILIEEENNFQYVPFIKPDKSKSYTLAGHFQHINYFKKHDKKIIEYIGIAEFQKSLKEKYAKTNFENIISMHFRIGDYKACSHLLPILNVEYYKKTLNKIILETNKNEWDVHYCCEEIDYLDVNKKIIILEKTFPKINFKRIDNGLEDWEQMIFMSLCNHNIVANSTFSWWSAYFNQNKDKIVCGPTTWYLNSNIPGLFSQKNWFKL